MENIICVSRQYGSGGREIGEAAARRLGVPCYDKCLVQRAARETGLSPRAVAERDETGDALELSLSGNPFADTAALGEAFYSEELQVYEAERRAILALAGIGAGAFVTGTAVAAEIRSAVLPLGLGLQALDGQVDLAIVQANDHHLHILALGQVLVDIADVGIGNL